MDVLIHKCPNCDGPLKFDPKDQKFHCEYCLNVYTEEEVTHYETQQKEARLADVESLSSSEPADSETITSENNETTKTASPEMELFVCSTCGAEIVTDATTAATYCYYCHNPVILSGRLTGDFLPDKVLPFNIEKDEAVNKFLAWTKKKRFIPKEFFNKNQVEKLTGVYFPYWVTKASIDGELDAKGTSLRVWRVGDIEYTETKQFDVSRKGKFTFKDLIKNALSKNVQQKMVESVQPFQLNQAIDFKSQYLAGFQAEKRDIEILALKDEIEKELKDYTQSLLRDSASGYSTLTNLKTRISISDENNHYMLLPIWLVTYRSNDTDKKTYYYAMNGQTGKISGVLPISYKRLGIFAGGVFAVLFLLFLIGAWFI